MLPLLAIVWYMIQSGRFIFSATWITTTQGRALDMGMAAALWWMAQMPQKMSLDDVHWILYGEDLKRSFLMYPPHDPRHQAFLRLDQPEDGHWPKRWWAFLRCEEMRHCVALVKREWDNSNNTGQLADNPNAMRRLREVARRFLLQNGSPAVRAVIRNYPQFLGFTDITLDGAPLDMPELRRTHYPEFDRNMPANFVWLGQIPPALPEDDDQADEGDPEDDEGEHL